MEGQVGIPNVGSCHEVCRSEVEQEVEFGLAPGDQSLVNMCPEIYRQDGEDKKCTHPRCSLHSEDLARLQRAEAALCEVGLLDQVAQFFIVLRDEERCGGRPVDVACGVVLGHHYSNGVFNARDVRDVLYAGQHNLDLKEFVLRCERWRS